MMIIGFGHRARQGKSFCADVMQGAAEVLKRSARIYSIGDEVQRWCAMRGILPAGKPREALTRDELQCLVNYGLAMRAQDENYWITPLLQRIQAESPDIALISNLRFPNEAQQVRQLGGVTVLVERHNADGSPYIAPDRDPNSPSETAMMAWHWNYRLSAASGDLDWLAAQACALLKVIVRRQS